jgi:CDP-diacylglycerol--serine O-phosphatidyltransferase
MEIPRNTLLPNLVTLGNGICGFAALVQLGKVRVGPDGELLNTENFKIAAFLILLGMVFDVFDGYVARLSRGATDFGAQLDSLCDLITFGLAPAMMIIRLNQGHQALWQNVVWFFSLAYFLGALLRLARFNVENAPEANAHKCFKGLPSPAAAGCVASLVIFQSYINRFTAPELQFIKRFVEPQLIQSWVSYVTYVLPFLALVLGFAMVSSRLKYDHFASKLFSRGYSVDFLVYLLFGILLLAMVPEVMLPVAFIGYLLWTPAKAAWRYVFRRQEEMTQLDDERAWSENQP